jgi:hypothetical protein
MWRCLVVLAVIVWSRGVGSVHFLKALVRLHQGSTQPQPAQPGIFTWSFNQSCSCSPDDGHNEHSNNSFQKVHTAYTMAPHNHSQHNQASSHEVLTSLVLVLLMIRMMMPKTCWDWFNSRNIHLIIVASVGSVIHLSKSLLSVTVQQACLRLNTGNVIPIQLTEWLHIN